MNNGNKDNRLLERKSISFKLTKKKSWLMRIQRVDWENKKIKEIKLVKTMTGFVLRHSFIDAYLRIQSIDSLCYFFLFFFFNLFLALSRNTRKHTHKFSLYSIRKNTYHKSSFAKKKHHFLCHFLIALSMLLDSNSKWIISPNRSCAIICSFLFFF